jgi:Carboxylesterase family
VRTLCLAVTACAIGLAGETALAQDRGALVVRTQSGPVRGVHNGAVDAFLGIPYGAPPVGDRRWRPTAAGGKLERRPGGESVRRLLRRHEKHERPAKRVGGRVPLNSAPKSLVCLDMRAITHICPLCRPLCAAQSRPIRVNFRPHQRSRPRRDLEAQPSPAACRDIRTRLASRRSAPA